MHSERFHLPIEIGTSGRGYNHIAGGNGRTARQSLLHLMLWRLMGVNVDARGPPPHR